MSQEKSAELRMLTVEDLQQKLTTARADLLTAQKSLKANELANPHAVTKLRREVARILTIQRESTQARHSRAGGNPGIDSQLKPENDSSESDDTKHQKGAK